MPSTPTRIGLIGDIHAEHEALDVALRVLGDQGADTLMAVGDIVDGPGSVERCCERLAEVGALAVRGNHERWFLAGTMRELSEATLTVGAEARAFLAALPAVRRFEAKGGEVLLCHGLGDDDMASMDPTDRWSLVGNPALTGLLADGRPRLVLNGHTHRRLVARTGNLTVVNAGTLYEAHEPCFALVDLGMGTVTYLNLRARGRVAEEAPLQLPGWEARA